MARMTPRERVRAALDHREPDRVPVCVGGTGGKITESRIQLLKEHFGIAGEAPRVLVGPQLMRLDDRVLDVLGTDVRYLYMRPPTGFRQHVAPDGGWYYDWGPDLPRARRRDDVRVHQPAPRGCHNRQPG